MLNEQDLNHLVNAAVNACKKAEAEGVDAAEVGRAVDALRVLAQQHVTASLLAKTEAGKRLKKLTKHKSSSVCDAANTTINAWKDCVRKDQAATSATTEAKDQKDQAAPSSQDSQQPGAAPTHQQDQRQQGSRDGTGTSSSSAPASNEAAKVKAEGVQGSAGQDGAAGQEGEPSSSGGPSKQQQPPLALDPPKTGDETRDKIRKLIADALAAAIGGDVTGDPCAAAVGVEEAMHTQNGGVTAKYKAKYRTLAFNLKDAKNPELRAKVLTGEIPGHKLINMSAEELAPQEMRIKNEQIREHMKNEAVRGQRDLPSTDLFQCGKCRQRKCTYYQLQTRSADEPMTTFVQCTVCNNRWKFC